MGVAGVFIGMALAIILSVGPWNARSYWAGRQMVALMILFGLIGGVTGELARLAIRAWGP